MTTIPGRAAVSIPVPLALIGCNSSETSETESTAAEEMPRTIQMTAEPRPFRMTGNQIVTDTFDVRYDLRDGGLAVVLDTDLGDAAKLMVSVSRSYWERGSDEEYPVDYFSESSIVGAWRDPRTITLDHDTWKRTPGSARSRRSAVKNTEESP